MAAPIIDQPVEGYYFLRRGPRGIMIPVRIWHSGERWRCTIVFDEHDVYEVWPWCCGSPLTEAEYVEQMLRIKTDTATRPWSPYANWRKKLDYLGLAETLK